MGTKSRETAPTSSTAIAPTDQSGPQEEAINADTQFTSTPPPQFPLGPTPITNSQSTDLIIRRNAPITENLDVTGARSLALGPEENAPSTSPPTPLKVPGMSSAYPLAAANPNILPKNSEILWVMMVVGAVILSMAWYRFSPTFKLRRRLFTLAQGYENSLADFQAHFDRVQDLVSKAAARYLAAVRRSHLQKVPLEEIKKLASGARMQPLRDVGVSSLLDVHNWSQSEFERVHGIGPESARKLHAACAELLQEVNRRPNPHPSLGDSNVEGFELLSWLYFQKRGHDGLKASRDALNSVADLIRVEWKCVRAGTGFWKWLLGSTSKGHLKIHLEAGIELERKAEDNGDAGATRRVALATLRSFQQEMEKPIDPDKFATEIESNSEFYEHALTTLLGPAEIRRKTAVRNASKVPQPSASTPASVSKSSDQEYGYSIPRVTQPQEISIPPPRPVPPPLPARESGDFWLPAGKSITLHGFVIDGGMLYIGRSLLALNQREPEPALIDPSQSISRNEANCHARQMDYWPSYSRIHGAARASFLQWLSSGRKDPNADAGFVFLYFYGLERRALHDATNNPTAMAEIPAIIAEVNRLREIYSSNRSFESYSREFLTYLEEQRVIDANGIDDEPIPRVRGHVPLGLRRRLGRLVVTRKPLPADLAFAWHYSDPRTKSSIAIERCSEQFPALFEAEYRREYDEGLVFPEIRTRLKITYRPASASFSDTLSRSTDIPDISVLNSTYSQLDAVATRCINKLTALSRYLRKNPNGGDSFEARLLAPADLWPIPLQQALKSLSGQIVPLRSLLKEFSTSEELSRSEYQSLGAGLREFRLGIEPDPATIRGTPELDDHVAIFELSGSEQICAASPLASLTLQLASAIAGADDEFSDAEASRLKSYIQEFPGLDVNARERLLTRLTVFRLKPPSTAGLRSTIAQLKPETKSQVLDCVIGVVLADGEPKPSEVKLLEKIFTLLGLEKASLYSRLHGLASNPVARESQTIAYDGTGPVKLDVEKVARLKAASDEVGKRLAAIFAEPDPSSSPKLETEPSAASEEITGTILGLDSAHAGLLTILLQRAQWTRSELAEMCSDQGLMPDGALERINEASFNEFDEAVIEGDDPLDVNLHLFNQNLK